MRYRVTPCDGRAGFGEQPTTAIVLADLRIERIFSGSFIGGSSFFPRAILRSCSAGDAAPGQ
jgi:hypothetical protein